MAFVDVPGHERFVKNMLAGVGGIDMVVLVIAADESVMPQTREHFAICRLLEVRSGPHRADQGGSRRRRDAGAGAARRARAGRRIAARRRADRRRVVEDRRGARRAQGRVSPRSPAALPERAEAGAPRLPIDRVFSMRGFGTVVTGTLPSGTLRVDEELVVLPSARRVKVRGIQVHGAARPSAGAGRRVAVNLGGVDVDEIGRGDTLTVAGRVRRHAALRRDRRSAARREAAAPRRARALSSRHRRAARARGAGRGGRGW